ncbi:MAG: universal stress protein [Chloroflexi bacterium]|nr:universal stress protein [Chloroflexota bacterium]
MASKAIRSESPGPVIVCLDDEHDIASLVQCGSAHARLADRSLFLVFLIVLPPQRPLATLSEEEKQRANTLLDLAADRAAAFGVETTEEIWITRSRSDAVQQMAEEFQASAVIVGWHGAGPFGLFDAGRTLLDAVGCPVIMVGLGTGRRAVSSWPPSWLSESLQETGR